ncbi:MAG: DNA cytosine methyltransferase [Verrucomicrobia bacterium]|nr:DNA cytosine methyltransferase [Verrucomicrobiota bacterium]
MERAGFRCLAAVDFNEQAIATFKANFGKETLALCKDLSRFTPHELAARIGVNSVDVIVGGPPCQGFSTVRQVDAANHGSRVRRDKRRYLFRYFLDYVAAFRPRVFVMENVLGLQSAAKGKFFTMVQAEARKLGYRVQAQVEEAWKLGVPQKRRRQLVIGVRDDIPGYFAGELSPAARAFSSSSRGHEAPFRNGAETCPRSESDQSLLTSAATPKLWDAIGDLPEVPAGGGVEECDYDLKRRNDFLAERGAAARHYLQSILEIERASHLTAHRARPHSERDLRDFARLRQGEHSGEAEARGESLEFTYSRSCFSDRYKRQHRDELCSTIVAHLSKDGLMFIHPNQNRSLTPREAARIQTFPDWFWFPVARTHQFRLIGNAVPPIVAEAVAEEVRDFLTAAQPVHQAIPFDAAPLPVTEDQAVAWVRPLLDLPPQALRRVETDVFKRAWIAIAFLYAGLHPDSALDHGETICRKNENEYTPVARLEPRLTAPYYERSGWPVVLAPIAREAWRRFRNKELADDDFYCSEAQMAGMCYRNPQLAEEVKIARVDFRTA